jgi:hypothetical protein
MNRAAPAGCGRPGAAARAAPRSRATRRICCLVSVCLADRSRGAWPPIAPDWGPPPSVAQPLQLGAAAPSPPAATAAAPRRPAGRAAGSSLPTCAFPIEPKRLNHLPPPPPPAAGGRRAFSVVCAPARGCPSTSQRKSKSRSDINNNSGTLPAVYPFCVSAVLYPSPLMARQTTARRPANCPWRPLVPRLPPRRRPALALPRAARGAAPQAVRVCPWRAAGLILFYLVPSAPL